MKQFTSPLNNVRIASPCKSDWDRMSGDNRRRFCGQCNLNVYNLSDMTRDEAEIFLMNSEGRVCVRAYYRPDGSIITQNCPVGWQMVKKRVSQVTTAVFSVFAGLLTGVAGVAGLDRISAIDFAGLTEKVAVDDNESELEMILPEVSPMRAPQIDDPVMMGRISEPVVGEVDFSTRFGPTNYHPGRR